MELQALIYERTGDKERLLLPKTEERVRSRSAIYKPREPVTSLMLDLAKTRSGVSGVGYGVSGAEYARADTRSPIPDTLTDVVDLVRAFRAARALSQDIRLITDEFLPPTADAFDGVDHFVLAGRRLADDPPGQVALSRWLELGGRLWVMLERSDPGVVAGLLGGYSGFHIVDRTSLTRVQIESSGHGPADPEPTVRQFERPVDFIRVELGPEFRILHRVNGWPASFTRTIGQGKVLITTLGARAWCRPRTNTDPASPFEIIAGAPVLMPAMQYLALQFQPGPTPTFPRSSSGSKESDPFAPLVKGGIGYSVVTVGTASVIFGGFLLILLILGAGLRKWGRLELLGWIGPVAALSTGGTFMALGEASRQSVLPTVAVAQRVAVNPRSPELSITGLLGYYNPDGGPAHISTTRGGLLEMDMSGLEGQTRRLVATDIDAWHWENLSLPPGVRLGSFRSVARTEEPISCVTHFGPRGLEGRLLAGRLRGLTDVLIQTPSRRAFSVRPAADGSFAIGENDLLSPDQFVVGTVLSDQQQKREAIYRRLLTDPIAMRPSEDSVLYAWADPIEVPFDFESGARLVGSALISIPLELEHTPPEERVTVPRGFIDYRRIMETGATRPTLDGQDAADQHLRFQVPHWVLPLKVERARLFVKVEAPSRKFVVSAFTKDLPVEIRSEQSPVNPLTIDIVPGDALILDKQGGLHLNIAVGESASTDGATAPRWTIQTLELEIVGTTLKRN
jgi:hypothetical protein